MPDFHVNRLLTATKKLKAFAEFFNVVATTSNFKVQKLTKITRFCLCTTSAINFSL